MQLFRSFIVVGILCVAVFGHAQTVGQPSLDEMTVADLRVYMDVLHIKDADERGVRAQMELQKKQLPPWWPPAVMDELTKQMLTVDFAALEYPFVKPCMNAADMKALTALFETPEGQAYANKTTGAMVAKEAGGADAHSAHEQMEKEDRGMPAAALNKLPVAQRERVTRMFQTGVMECISEGFRKGSVAVSDARTQAARQVVEEHHAELQAAKEKYEAANPAPRAK
jgi:hypothetical protein